MQYALAVFGLAAGLASARAFPQAVTAAVSPSSPAPSGCVTTYSGEFTLAKAINSKRAINPNSLAPNDIILTLVNGVMEDTKGETAYIASNQQFQFDKPPQAGAIYTAGFSICPNMTIALGNSAVFYQCESGAILNIYDTPAESACSPIFLEAIPLSGTGASLVQPGTTPAATTPAAPATSAAVITSISDAQPQAPTSAAVITSISDHQPQAPTTVNLITSITDHQPQVGTATGYSPPPVPTLPANGAAKMFGGELAALAAGALAVAML